MKTGNDEGRKLPRQSAKDSAVDEPREDAPEVKSKPAEAPKNEMYPQDDTDRSLDVEAVRDEMRRQWPAPAEWEKREG